MQKHLQYKKVWPSKVESYLHGSKPCVDWQRQDLISEYGQGLSEYKHYTRHNIASYCLQSLIGLANFAFNHILLQFSYFKRSTREHEIHDYLSFGCLFVSD